MANFERQKGNRFDSAALHEFQGALQTGESFDIDKWRMYNCGSAHGVRGQLRAVADEILRVEGHFPLPVATIEHTLGFTAILGENQQ